MSFHFYFILLLYFTRRKLSNCFHYSPEMWAFNTNPGMADNTQAPNVTGDLPLVPASCPGLSLPKPASDSWIYNSAPPHTSIQGPGTPACTADCLLPIQHNTTRWDGPVHLWHCHHCCWAPPLHSVTYTSRCCVINEECHAQTMS